MSPKLDFNLLKTVPLDIRPSKVRLEAFAQPVKAGATIDAFFDALPDFLGASDLMALARRSADRILQWA